MNIGRHVRQGMTMLLLAASFFGAGGMKLSSADEGSGPGTRRALLIGINKYSYVPPLQGSINDIETMRQILVTRFGFPENKITMVKDTEATRAGIIAALEGLVKEAGPDDVVYFHYSGHGSQVKDLNGDEEDGLDETLIPQDGRGPNVPDIIDDELDEMLSRLKARSALIVLDSCHSGTATRSVAMRTRSVPPESDSRLALYRKWSTRTRGIVPIDTRYVLMTGAASHQPALDGPVDGRYHGLFTYSLSKSLGSADPEASPHEVFSGIIRELKRIQAQLGLIAMPEPQLEGPKERLESRPVFPPVTTDAATTAPQNARQAWAEVKPLKGNRVLLIEGLSLGGQAGSMWAIYGPAETRFIGRAKALAVADGAEGKNTVAILEAGERTLPAGSRAILLAPPPASGRVPVLLRDVPPERRAGLEADLKKRLGEVDLVRTGSFARFVVDLQNDQIKVYGADGLHEVATYRQNDPQWSDKLAQVITRSVTASELMALDNPSAQIRVEARIAAPGVRGDTTRRGIVIVQDLAAAHYRIRKSGEPRTSHNSLQLEIRSSADCFMTVVDVDSQGGVNLLFPTSYQKPGFHPEGAIRAGEIVLLPDSLQSGNQAGFHWDYSPPAGTDTIRVFCSTDRETANMLRQRIQGVTMTASIGMPGHTATRGISGAAPGRPGGLGGLRGILVRRRGLIVVPDEPEVNPVTVPGAGTPGVPAPGVVPMPPETIPPMTMPPAHAGGLDPSQPTGTAASGQAQAMYAGMPAPDWTATSVTVVIEE